MAAKCDAPAAAARAGGVAEDGHCGGGPVAACCPLPAAEGGPWASVSAAGGGGAAGAEGAAWMVGGAARGAVAWGTIEGRRLRGPRRRVGRGAGIAGPASARRPKFRFCPGFESVKPGIP